MFSVCLACCSTLYMRGLVSSSPQPLGKVLSLPSFASEDTEAWRGSVSGLRPQSSRVALRGPTRRPPCSAVLTVTATP